MKIKKILILSISPISTIATLSAVSCNTDNKQDHENNQSNKPKPNPGDHSSNNNPKKELTLEQVIQLLNKKNEFYVPASKFPVISLIKNEYEKQTDKSNFLITSLGFEFNEIMANKNMKISIDKFIKRGPNKASITLNITDKNNVTKKHTILVITSGNTELSIENINNLIENKKYVVKLYDRNAEKFIEYANSKYFIDYIKLINKNLTGNSSELYLKNNFSKDVKYLISEDLIKDILDWNVIIKSIEYIESELPNIDSNYTNKKLKIALSTADGKSGFISINVKLKTLADSGIIYVNKLIKQLEKTENNIRIDDSDLDKNANPIEVIKAINLLTNNLPSDFNFAYKINSLIIKELSKIAKSLVAKLGANDENGSRVTFIDNIWASASSEDLKNGIINIGAVINSFGYKQEINIKYIGLNKMSDEQIAAIGEIITPDHSPLVFSNDKAGNDAILINANKYFSKPNYYLSLNEQFKDHGLNYMSQIINKIMNNELGVPNQFKKEDILTFFDNDIAYFALNRKLKVHDAKVTDLKNGSALLSLNVQIVDVDESKSSSIIKIEFKFKGYAIQKSNEEIEKNIENKIFGATQISGNQRVIYATSDVLVSTINDLATSSERLNEEISNKINNDLRKIFVNKNIESIKIDTNKIKSDSNKTGLVPIIITVLNDDSTKKEFNVMLHSNSLEIYVAREWKVFQKTLNYNNNSITVDKSYVESNRTYSLKNAISAIKSLENTQQPKDITVKDIEKLNTYLITLMGVSFNEISPKNLVIYKAKVISSDELNAKGQYKLILTIGYTTQDSQFVKDFELTVKGYKHDKSATNGQNNTDEQNKEILSNIEKKFKESTSILTLNSEYKLSLADIKTKLEESINLDWSAIVGLEDFEYGLDNEMKALFGNLYGKIIGNKTFKYSNIKLNTIPKKTNFAVINVDAKYGNITQNLSITITGFSTIKKPASFDESKVYSITTIPSEAKMQSFIYQSLNDFKNNLTEFNKIDSKYTFLNVFGWDLYDALNGMDVQSIIIDNSTLDSTFAENTTNLKLIIKVKDGQNILTFNPRVNLQTQYLLNFKNAQNIQNSFNDKEYELQGVTDSINFINEINKLTTTLSPDKQSHEYQLQIAKFLIKNANDLYFLVTDSNIKIYDIWATATKEQLKNGTISINMYLYFDSYEFQLTIYAKGFTHIVDENELNSAMNSIEQINPVGSQKNIDILKTKYIENINANIAEDKFYDFTYYNKDTVIKNRINLIPVNWSSMLKQLSDENQLIKELSSSVVPERKEKANKLIEKHSNFVLQIMKNDLNPEIYGLKLSDIYINDVSMSIKDNFYRLNFKILININGIQKNINYSIKLSNINDTIMPNDLGHLVSNRIFRARYNEYFNVESVKYNNNIFDLMKKLNDKSIKPNGSAQEITSFFANVFSYELTQALSSYDIIDYSIVEDRWSLDIAQNAITVRLILHPKFEYTNNFALDVRIGFKDDFDDIERIKEISTKGYILNFENMNMNSTEFVEKINKIESNHSDKQLLDLQLFETLFKNIVGENIKLIKVGDIVLTNAKVISQNENIVTLDITYVSGGKIDNHMTVSININ